MRSANRSIKYIDWLLRTVRFNKPGYTRLIHCLFEIPYEAIIVRDENRIDDALSLRSEYPRNYNENGDPNVLEVLVALALRIDEEYIGDPSDPSKANIFWEMLCNLELDKQTDIHFDEELVYEIIEGWLSRDFGYDGEGSPFPIKYPIQDQTKIELWFQAQEYLSENYS